MALSRAQIIRRNAQALELFIRVSPVATGFLQHFKTDPADPSMLHFHMESPLSENPDIPSAIVTDTHIKQLEAYGITVDPAEYPADTDDEEKLGLYYSIDLTDPAFSEKTLTAAASIINHERQTNPGYTLSYFPTSNDMQTHAELAAYEGFKDKKGLQLALSKSFTHDVTASELAALAHKMEILANAGKNRGGAL